MTKSGELFNIIFCKSKTIILIICSETKTTYVDSSRNEEVVSGSARDSHSDHRMQPCNTSSFCLAPELPASLDNFTYGEFTSNTAGFFQVKDKFFEIGD